MRKTKSAKTRISCCNGAEYFVRYRLELIAALYRLNLLLLDFSFVCWAIIMRCNIKPNC